MRAPFVLSLTFALLTHAMCARAGGRVHWPALSTNDRDDVDDPIAGVRWNTEGWTVVGTVAPARVALDDLDTMLAAHPADPLLHARRAVVLRVLQRFDDARAELERAIARDPRVEDDPDVALTHAYLLARANDFDAAVALARRALPRLSGNDDARTQIVLEIARWSMARGPAGLADAISVLREITGPSASDAIARAMLALALHRAGRDDEAREIVRGGALPSPYASTALRAGGLIDGETDAAVGTAYLLAGRPREGIAFLARASTRAPAPWRTGIATSLAEAQRSAPAERSPAPSPTATPTPMPPRAQDLILFKP